MGRLTYFSEIMNCEECLKDLSDYIDGELDQVSASAVRSHISSCADCALFHDDFVSLLTVCVEEREAETGPPNSQALWCRINNIIESDVEKEKETAPVVTTVPQRSFWAKLRWQVSLGQAFAAILCVGLLSSLLTFVALKNISTPDREFSTANAHPNAQPSIFDRALSKVGLLETPAQARERRVKEQQAAIEYWNQRIEARRAAWDKNVRATFDRNLQEIDQVVFEHTQTLESNPQDELSVEMLDSALSEKMQLLREFAEL